MCNFDKMTMRELDTWLEGREWYSPLTRAQAAEIVGDTRRGYTRIAGDIIAYATNRRWQLWYERHNEIADATTCAVICRRIYNRLPADLRW